MGLVPCDAIVPPRRNGSVRHLQAVVPHLLPDALAGLNVGDVVDHVAALRGRAAPHLRRPRLPLFLGRRAGDALDGRRRGGPRCRRALEAARAFLAARALLALLLLAALAA